MTGPASLASSFYGTSRGARGTDGTEGLLETALRDFRERGRHAWPDVDLDAATLAAWLGERAPPDAPPLPWLAELRAGDLFLACACAEGLPRALRAFEAAFLDKVGVYLRALHPTPQIVAETRQELLEKLFVCGPEGTPPKIRQYAGHGALGGWVRIAAVRTALNLLEAERAGRPRTDEADEVARGVVPASDPEIELMRASYKQEFVAALREAMAGLSQRSRSLLRFAFVERLTPARVGAMYGVHRTTAMRWIEAAQEEVLAGTRARMMAHLRVSPSECDRLFALVRSQIDITLTSLLKTGA